MKGMVIGWLVRLLGLKKAWEAFSGKKAYIGGIASILVGVGTVATQLAGAGSPAELFELAKGLADSPAVAMILGGLSVVGLRHSNEKLEEKLEKK